MNSFLEKFVFAGLVLCLLVCGSDTVLAQAGSSNARSVGMAGAYTALARGVESPSWNPANLGLSGKRKYHFNLISFGVGLNNNSFTMNDYDRYNGEYLTDTDKEDILSSIPAEGLFLDAGSEVQALGFSFGTFAFTATGLGASDISVSKDVAELVLNGNEFGRAYDIRDSDGEAWGVSSFAFSSAFRLDVAGTEQFAVGLSVKYLRGFAYAKVIEARTSINTDIDGLNTNGRLVVDQALGGSGYSFDLGAAAQLQKGWSWSLGVSNLFNEINWSTDTERFTYEFSADSASVELIDDTDIDSVFIDSDETVDIDPFKSRLPSELRFGLGHTSDKLTVGLDMQQGMERGAGVSTSPRFALGTEFRLIGFFPMRLGAALGGGDGFSGSAGFGLDFSVFSWDFAVLSRSGAFGGKGLGMAFDWMFRF